MRIVNKPACNQQCQLGQRRVPCGRRPFNQGRYRPGGRPSNDDIFTLHSTSLLLTTTTVLTSSGDDVPTTSERKGAASTGRHGTVPPPPHRRSQSLCPFHSKDTQTPISFALGRNYCLLSEQQHLLYYIKQNARLAFTNRFKLNTTLGRRVLETIDGRF